MQDLKVSIIQTPIFWEQKDENLKMFSQKINAITEETDLIILPEMFTTGFTMKPSQFAEVIESETLKRMLSVRTVVLLFAFARLVSTFNLIFVTRANFVHAFQYFVDIVAHYLLTIFFFINGVTTAATPPAVVVSPKSNSVSTSGSTASTGISPLDNISYSK